MPTLRLSSSRTCRWRRVSATLCARVTRPLERALCPKFSSSLSFRFLFPAPAATFPLASFSLFQYPYRAPHCFSLPNLLPLFPYFLACAGSGRIKRKCAPLAGDGRCTVGDVGCKNGRRVLWVLLGRSKGITVQMTVKVVAATRDAVSTVPRMIAASVGFVY